MVNFTPIDGSCPNPAEVLAAQYLSLATSIREAICKESELGKNYTDEQFSQLQTQLNAIEGYSDLATRITELQSFLDSLDENGDGTIDALVTLQSELDALKSRIDTLESSVSENAASIVDLSNELTSFKVTTNNSINALENKVLQTELNASNALQAATEASNAATVATQLANEVKAVNDVQNSQITDLQAQIDGIESFDTEKATQLAEATTCQIYSALRDGLIAAQAAFEGKLGEGCTVYVSADTSTPPMDDEPPVGDGAPPVL